MTTEKAKLYKTAQTIADCDNFKAGTFVEVRFTGWGKDCAGDQMALFSVRGAHSQTWIHNYGGLNLKKFCL